MDHNKQRITLKIADKKIITYINRRDEAYLKKVEEELNNLWNQFKVTQPGREDDEYIALVAFQYAKMYYDTLEQSRKREEALQKFLQQAEKRMDDILLDVK
ncbi:MAG: cell division protein ZapA [Bacteroidales bacterium]|nr:cell division protein ZapA [Bacteroidales bacterium]MDD6140905.1 cell division protein ZapA [Bacteroidales bacterium]MDD6622950.1 cell division protein ZapA [Bacteroidales bacterium]MDD6668362.1 cell division protein ZapA [Bacteroidales bacterium]